VISNEVVDHLSRACLTAVFAAVHLYHKNSVELYTAVKGIANNYRFHLKVFLGFFYLAREAVDTTS
jgi:hypothetical protein